MKLMKNDINYMILCVFLFVFFFINRVDKIEKKILFFLILKFKVF